MSYESVAYVCQLLAMVIFAAVMVGILIHALRPANKARFEAAARLPLGDDLRSGDKLHGD